MKPGRIELLGVPVDCVNLSQALGVVEEMIQCDRPGTVIAVNPEKVIKARKNPGLLAPLREARLLIPDGIGVVMAARLLGLGRMERVPGSDLMPAICALAARKGYRIFLFGASPEVNRDAMFVLKRRFPGIRIVGGQHGYLKEDEMPDLIDRINASGAEVLFIALGSPRQEAWLARYLPLLKVKVCQGVGGTFDVLSGRVKRAPAVFRRIHLEWLYRLLSEPRRLLRQTALPRFAMRVLWQFVIG
jgi:N-acetylglucosaminyldiphosphoundecaprenol N-acetyl-beta-D-mannosaminyltransferase